MAWHTPALSGTIRHWPHPAGRSGICCGPTAGAGHRRDTKRHYPEHGGSHRHPLTRDGIKRHAPFMSHHCVDWQVLSVMSRMTPRPEAGCTTVALAGDVSGSRTRTEEGLVRC